MADAAERIDPEEAGKEGIAMDHCVASYAREAASGGLSLYRVTAPLRATLAIRNIGNDRWEKQELRGSSNAVIPSLTQQSLYDELFRSRGPR